MPQERENDNYCMRPTSMIEKLFWNVLCGCGAVVVGAISVVIVVACFKMVANMLGML